MNERPGLPGRSVSFRSVVFNVVEWRGQCGRHGFRRSRGEV